MNFQSEGMFLTDITERIHDDLNNLSEYNEVKKYINEHFQDFNNPGDTTGYNFPKLNKSILCKMGEESTIMVLCKRNDKEDVDWVYLKIPEAAQK